MIIKRTELLRSLLITSLGALGLAGASAQLKTNVNILHHLEQQYATDAFVGKMAARQKATALGMPIKGTLADGNFFEAIDVENGRPVYYITHNVDAADSISTDEVQPGGSLGLTLTGAGVTLLEWDGGTARTTHQELSGRVVIPDGGSFHTHSTHVAGTLIGSGVNAIARGMAYQANLRSYDWDSDAAEMANQAAAGYQISNHSYGNISGWYWSGSNWYWYGEISWSGTEDFKFGIYNDRAQEWDTICYNAPYYLPVKSAGNDRGEVPASQPTGYFWYDNMWYENTVSRPADGGADGYDSISTYGNAKNILTVGAVEDVIGGYDGPESVVMSSFSGWGPTNDGRIKPDIVGNGIGVTSATNVSNTSYDSFNGTSMSSPSVAGSLGLLIQHYGDTHAGARMRASTIKGLALHTADECGSFDGPDYSFGWGLMNTASAAQVISDDVALTSSIQEEVLNDGNTFTQTVYAHGAGPLKVTIAWTDPQGPIQNGGANPSNVVLVNDLDLRVSNGTTYMPWVLDGANPANAATTGDNVLDNVEQVWIEAPAAGAYEITVSHKGELTSGVQAFSMIVTGHTAAEAGEVSGLVISPTTIYSGQTATGTVTIGAPAEAGGVAVNLQSDDTNVATVPASVTVLEGETTADFTITAGQVASTSSATITASSGETNSTAMIQVEPAPTSIQTLALNPQSFGWWEGTTATITLNEPAPAGGTTITLMTSSTRGSVQPSVTIPEGQTSATVPVSSNLTDPARAWNFRVFAFLNGSRAEISATIIPARFTMLAFRWPTVPMGHSVVMVVRTNWHAPAGGWTIGLESSNPTLVPMPETATIPQGRAHVVVVVPTGSQVAAENVTITATLHSDTIQNSVFVFP